MKLKKGDKIFVIAGTDKGKTGVISRVLAESGRVVVDGLNLQTKHEKARGSRKGKAVQRPASIHASNVMILDPKTGSRSRIGVLRKDGARVRISKKSSSEI